jgi:CCR4-NOT transcription complex subunit 2
MFSGQQESLLVGSGAGGVFSLGNGFGNDSGITGGVNASSGTSFDLSDFPSLGGGGGGGGVGAGSGNGLAAALREQQQILAHQQMLQGGTGVGVGVGSKTSNLYMLAMTGSNGNFQIANEDFPALGGGRPQTSVGGVGNGSGLNVSSLLSNNVSVQPGSSMENGLYGGGLDSGSSQLEGGAGLLGGAGLGGLGGLQNAGTSLSSVPLGSANAGAIGSSTAAGSVSAAGNALSGDYGLLGLLGVIRMTDADRNALALGTDLQLLGLNLGTAEQIYSTFASPWSDGGATKEPHYEVRKVAQ